MTANRSASASFIHQKSDVAPENVDAIRAMLKLEKDGRRSIEKTDRSLGIGG